MSAQRSSIIETRVSFYIQFVFCSAVIFFFADVALCFISWMGKYESALALLMDLNIFHGFYILQLLDNMQSDCTFFT